MALTRRRVVGRFATAGAQGATALGAACTPPWTQPPAPATEPTVQLTYVHGWMQSQGHGPATTELTQRFRHEFPTTQVTEVYTADHIAKLTVMLAAGDVPDIVSYPVDFLGFLFRRGVAASPETLAKGQYRIDKNDLIPVSRAFATFDGKLMAMPYLLADFGLAYNQTLFAQKGLDPNRPPATWDELVDLGRRLTSAPGGNADDQTFGLEWFASWAPFVCLVWEHGGETLDVQRRVPTWNGPAGVEALQFLVDLVQKHRIASLTPPPNPAFSGRAGMWFTHVGGLSSALRAIGSQFEWGATALPRGRQRVTGVGGHAMLVLKANRHEERAWRYVHWFSAPRNVVEFNAASTTMPPWRSAQQQPTWQRFTREQPRIKPFVDMLEYGRPWPPVGADLQIQTALTGAVASAATLQQAPKQALDEAARVAAPVIQSL